MAIQQTDGTSFTKRYDYGNFPSNTSDWTIGLQFRYTNTPVGFATILDLFKTSGGSENFYLGNDTANVSNVFIEVSNAAGTDVTTATQVITVNNWNSAYITYNSTSHILTLYVNGSLIGTATLDLSASTWSGIQVLGNGSGSPNVSVAYFRSWSNILTFGEMTIEIASTVAVKQTGLIFDNPLQASIDLTAHNNTLNQLNAVGTVTTDTTDPLVSIVAGPPTNISPATATVITTNSVYFQNVNTTGVATNVWHVVTAPAGILEMGACSFGDLVTYKPTIRVYEGLANANSNTPIPTISHNVPNSPIQFPVTIGLDYYFQTVRNAAVAASTLQISVLNGLNLAVPAGSFAVNDDAPGLPLVLLDRTTAYPIRFIQPFPAGEGGTVLPSGIAAVTNDDDVGVGDAVTLVTGTSITTTVNLLPDTGYQCMSDNQAHTFYAGSPNASTTATSKIVAISDAGVLSTTSWSLPQSGIYTLGVNKESTIAYYGSNSGAAQPIHRYDLVNSTTLSDLVTSPAGHSTCKDIIVLSDDSILVLFNQNATSLLLNQYSTTGSVILSTNLGANTAHSIDARLARALEVGHIWVWVKLNSPTNVDIFERVRIVDGVIVETTPQSAEFEGGMNQAVASNTPIRFGHSESCPFWVIQGSITPANPGGGIYLLTGTSTPNPRQNHDTIWVDSGAGTTQNLAIPDPTFETYLAGDE